MKDSTAHCQSFEFIDYSKARSDDPETRKRIRSYVMRKSHTKEGQRHNAVRSVEASLDLNNVELRTTSTSQDTGGAWVVPREFTSFDPFGSTKMQLQPYMLDIFSKCRRKMYCPNVKILI